MAVKGRRKNFKIGGSTAFTIPSDMSSGEESTLAADRIMLVDPRGIITPEELEEFLEQHVEPLFWKWHGERSKNASEKPNRMAPDNLG